MIIREPRSRPHLSFLKAQSSSPHDKPCARRSALPSFICFSFLHLHNDRIGAVRQGGNVDRKDAGSVRNGEFAHRFSRPVHDGKTQPPAAQGIGKEDLQQVAGRVWRNGKDRLAGFGPFDAGGTIEGDKIRTIAQMEGKNLPQLRIADSEQGGDHGGVVTVEVERVGQVQVARGDLYSTSAQFVPTLNSTSSGGSSS